jgi:hypothetical protein
VWPEAVLEDFVWSGSIPSKETLRRHPNVPAKSGVVDCIHAAHSSESQVRLSGDFVENILRLVVKPADQARA